MDAVQPEAALREELRRVEQELAELRPVAADLRRRIGEEWDAPADAADTAAAITIAEEQEAVIAELEGRRSELRKRLGED
jgi:hypothetical protein